LLAVGIDVVVAVSMADCWGAGLVPATDAEIGAVVGRDVALTRFFCWPREATSSIDECALGFEPFVSTDPDEACALALGRTGVTCGKTGDVVAREGDEPPFPVDAVEVPVLGEVDSGLPDCAPEPVVEFCGTLGETPALSVALPAAGGGVPPVVV